MSEDKPGANAAGADEPRTHVRRRDRAKEDAWVRAALKKADYGFLATVHDGQPFLNSNLFVYDESAHVIYMHTAHVGRTRTNLEADQHCCFSIATMGRMLPAPEALEFSVEYAGVVVFGKGSVVTDDAEKERGLQLLLDRYAPHLRPGRDYRPITAGELKRTGVYRIDIETWSGKQKVADPEHPGAFHFGIESAFPW